MADGKQEIGQYFFTGLRMDYFGVELQAVKIPLSLARCLAQAWPLPTTKGG